MTTALALKTAQQTATGFVEYGWSQLECRVSNASRSSSNSGYVLTTFSTGSPACRYNGWDQIALMPHLPQPLMKLTTTHVAALERAAAKVGRLIYTIDEQ